MKGKRIPFRALWLWELYAGLGYAFLLLLIYIFLVPFTWLWFWLVSLFSGLFLLTTLAFLPVVYWRTRYEVNEERIQFQTGVLFRRVTVLFCKNLIVVSLFQTPLDSLFRLASLRCSGPGGVVTLGYLSKKEASYLREELMARKRLKPVREMTVRNETDASH